MKIVIRFGLIALLFSSAIPAWAFDQLVCESSLDVRLIPRKGKPKFVSKKQFTVTRKDALELDLLVDGISVGQIFPWDHVVWQEAKVLTAFKDVKFKTDDSTLIDFSLTTIADKKEHDLKCSFRFSE